MNDKLERMYRKQGLAYFEGTTPAFEKGMLTASIIRTYHSDNEGSKHF